MADDVSWSRVKDIVADAIAHPATERARFLDDACGTDAALKREVESLLSAHDAARDFIEQPAIVPTDALLEFNPGQTTAIPAGASIGPYRIVRLLGAGGMGLVYLADRADEAFHRQVAIKVVTSAAAKPELVERFLTERRILAALDHANIARLLDAGATDDGRPYIVMEYVDGERIDDYCRGRSLAERLDLFRQLCSAVHYAHQRLVIHRDIKAENILVNREGVPKLLDFGIAKLLEAEGSRTDTGEQALTPESASPEQLRAEPVTVASDVYSLGVLLYRLLAERKPFDRESLSPADLVRSICEVEPQPPSRVTASGAPRLNRELDGITLMAMRKEPSRRYGSAQQLAEDITRYLEGRPVIATPDGWIYRTRKFARRQWAAVAATVALIVALAVGASTTFYQARRAERRFSDVRKLAGSVVGEIYDAIADLPGSTAPRELLVKRALEYLDSLAAEATSDVALHRELAAAYEKVGDVQGNPYGANLGDVAGAAATMDKLLRIRQEIFDEQPTSDDARALAVAHTKVGDVAYGRGKYVDAAASYRRGLDLIEAAALPPVAKAEQLRERWYGRLGVALTAAGRSDDAVKALQTALEIARPLADANAAAADVQQDLAMHATNLGDVYNLQRDFARALEFHQLGAGAFRRLTSRDDQLVTPRRRLALVVARVGADLTDLQRHDEGIVVTREAIRLFEDIARADPSSVQYQFDLADTLGNLAMLQAQAGALDDAFESAQRSVAISEAAVPSQQFGDHRFNYAGAVAVLAEIRARRGESIDAARAYQRSLAIYAEPGVADRNPPAVPIAQEGLGDAFVSRARTERAVALWRSARQQYELALAGWNALKRSGALAPGDAGKPAALEKKIAECDAALGRAGGASR